MSYIQHDEDQTLHSLDIDQLYEKQHQRILKQLGIFNVILNRVHQRIKKAARTSQIKHIWYEIPLYIIGQPIYDKGDCVAYVVNKLAENGFYVRVFEVNKLYITWSNWVPQYVRSEIKQKQGIAVDSFGNVMQQPTEVEQINEEVEKTNKKKYLPTNAHKLTSSLVYQPDVIDELERKMKKG